MYNGKNETNSSELQFKLLQTNDLFNTLSQSVNMPLDLYLHGDTINTSFIRFRLKLNLIHCKCSRIIKLNQLTTTKI